MRVAMVIGAMALLAIAVVMLIAWLSNRASVALRAAGALGGVRNFVCEAVTVRTLLPSPTNR